MFCPDHREQRLFVLPSGRRLCVLCLRYRHPEAALSDSNPKEVPSDVSEMERYNEKQSEWLESLRKAGYDDYTEVVKVEGEPHFNKLVQIHDCELPKVPLEVGTDWTCPCNKRWIVKLREVTERDEYDEYGRKSSKQGMVIEWKHKKLFGRRKRIAVTM